MLPGKYSLPVFHGDNLVTDIYSINLDTGSLETIVSETGQVINSTIDELSGGRLTLQGTDIIDTSTGEVISSLNPQEQNYIQQLGEGQLVLQRPKAVQDINNVIESGGIDAVSFGYDLTLPDGRSFNRLVDQTTVTPIEGLVIVRPTETGGMEFATIVPTYEGTTITNIPEGFRLATPTEAIQRAITGYLMSDLQTREDLELIASARVQDENGNYMESAYEVAQFISRTGFFNIAALMLKQL